MAERDAVFSKRPAPVRPAVPKRVGHCSDRSSQARRVFTSVQYAAKTADGSIPQEKRIGNRPFRRPALRSTMMRGVDCAPRACEPAQKAPIVGRRSAGAETSDATRLQVKDTMAQSFMGTPEYPGSGLRLWRS